MNVPKGQLAVALVAVLLCIGLWYQRLVDPDAVMPHRSPATKTAEKPASAPPPAAVDGTAPVLATIAWADTENPAAIPLSGRGNRFLFDTKDGLNIWDADNLTTQVLQHPDGKVRLLDKFWMRAHRSSDNGTMFAVAVGSTRTAVVLYWLPDSQNQLASRLDLPDDFFPSALVRLSSDTALLCAAKVKRALLVRMIDNALKFVDVSSWPESVLPMLKQAGVVGSLEGIGQLGEPGREGYPTYERPLLFDTHICAWKARKLPEPLASADNLEILPQSIGFIHPAPSIVAAGWIDRSSRSPRTLDAPLIWDWQDEHWLAQKTADLPILAPGQLAGVGEKGWSYAADPAQGRFAFLAPFGERWQESSQRLPATEKLKLLPIGAEGVLALLIDARQPGRIARLDPASETSVQSRLPNRLADTDSMIPLGGGELMIVQGRRSSYVSILRPIDSKILSLPGLPQPQQRVSGLQLSDGSVVIFGGLHPSCYASDLHNCPHGTQPSFRWIPAEKRWQPLPTLAVPFAYGEALDGGNSGITTAYRRSDFLLHQGTEVFFLSSQKARPGDSRTVEPTLLFRWSLGGTAQLLAATQLSRYNPTLLELNDGRIAAVGGSAANEPPSPACQVCRRTRQAAVARLKDKMAQGPAGTARIDDETGMELDPEAMVPPCESCTALPTLDHFAFARSCELYDPRVDRWTLGPYANHPGGRALRLANGRLFKFGLLGYNATDAMYAAETADPALTRWTAAPPFPFRNPAEVANIQALGNQVLVIMAKPADRYVLWDDDSRRWQVYPLPRHADWGLRNIPQHISQTDAEHMLAIYPDSYEYLPWPLQ
jgi:hypothetical protein